MVIYSHAKLAVLRIFDLKLYAQGLTNHFVDVVFLNISLILDYQVRSKCQDFFFLSHNSFFLGKNLFKLFYKNYKNTFTGLLFILAQNIIFADDAIAPIENKTRVVSALRRLITPWKLNILKEFLSKNDLSPKLKNRIDIWTASPPNYQVIFSYLLLFC